MVVFYAYDTGILNKLTEEALGVFQANICKFIEKKYPALYTKIKENESLTSEIKKGLNEAFVDFFRTEKII